jgi:hypothetical protein
VFVRSIDPGTWKPEFIAQTPHDAGHSSIEGIVGLFRELLNDFSLFGSDETRIGNVD